MATWIGAMWINCAILVPFIIAICYYYQYILCVVHFAFLILFADITVFGQIYEQCSTT